MMLKRHNQILAGILIIQIVICTMVFWPKSAVTNTNEPVFSDVQAEDIVAMTILDADGNSVALRRIVGEWVLPDADDYPAEADKIGELLDKIVGLTTERLVTRTDASHQRLQVAAGDFVRRVDLEMKDGATRTLFLGSSPNYGATHFRLEGQSETYLTSDISAWEVSGKASGWIDTAYLRVPQDDIVGMTLENPNGVLTFVKDDQGVWTMIGLAPDENADDAKITALLQRAASVSMIAPLGKTDLDAYGMEVPNAVVTLKTSERTVSLRVGARDPSDDSYVVISSESSYYVSVAEYGVADLVEKSYDDFLLVLPTPTP